MAKEEKKSIHFEIDVERYNKITVTMKEKGFETYPQYFEPLIDGRSFLSPELLKMVDSFFIEGTPEEKLTKMARDYLQWHEKFPYLNIQREITPEDAGFLPCPYIKAFYWEGKFLGFQCRSIKPLAFKLTTLRFPTKNGTLSIQVTTQDDCFDCIELRKQAGTGVGLKGLPTLEEIERYRLRMKEIKEQNKPPSEKEVFCTLQEAGLRMTDKKAKEVFQILHYDNEKQKWKRKAKASRLTGISRSTIDKIIKAFPKGIP